jgi:uncharacterized protein YndB with AHSA1/START domain
MTELTVNIEKTIHAPIAKVFDAWLDPAMLTRFILPDPAMPQPEVENDPREGGRFTIVMQAEAAAQRQLPGRRSPQAAEVQLGIGLLDR